MLIAGTGAEIITALRPEFCWLGLNFQFGSEIGSLDAPETIPAGSHYSRESHWATYPLPRLVMRERI